MTDHDEIGWCVVRAEVIYLAEDELGSRGVDIHVPMRFWRERITGKRVMACEPLIPPYLFACFALADKHQHNEILRTRGVAAHGVLLNGHGKPSRISPFIVMEHRARERYERRTASAPRANKDTSGLELLATYAIKVGGLFAGYRGKLIAVSRGIAHLDCDGRMLQLPVTDIMAEVAAKRRAA